MNRIAIIAAKEFRDGLRNRWVVAMTLALALFALTLTFLGSAPTGAVKAGSLAVVVVSLSSLTIFLLPLIALLLSYDAIVGDIERGTMALLLSYPLTRHQVIIGKFLGHLCILSVSTIVGYGVAGVAASVVSPDGFDFADWQPFIVLLLSSVALGASFLAIGYLISTQVRERATAAGIAIGVWLFFVLVYDMALLGLLVADQGETVSAQALGWLLLLNPADAYRLLNLTGFSGTAALSGMAGVAGQAGHGLATLATALAIWIAAPFLLAMAAFHRKSL